MRTIRERVRAKIASSKKLPENNQVTISRTIFEAEEIWPEELTDSQMEAILALSEELFYEQFLGEYNMWEEEPNLHTLQMWANAVSAHHA